MLRAMDSAVAGLRAHQNKLDVIGNNIANVNTFGFKAQTYSFKDAMYQTSTASSGGSVKKEDGKDAAGTYVAGVNGAQYGYGTMTGAITTDMTSSTPSYVGGFNASINGSGFFITSSTPNKVELSKDDDNNNKGDTTKNSEAASKTSDALKNAGLTFTRVGQFSIDANGYIVDANQNYVMGFSAEQPRNSATKFSSDLVALKAPSEIASGTTGEGKYDLGSSLQMKSVSIDNDGTIRGVIDDNGQSTSIVLGKVAVAGFQNEQGLMKAGNNGFNTTPGDNAGMVTAKVPGDGSTPNLMAGYLEGSNVDLAKEFADMITTQRGFQANSKIITVSDEVLQELVNMKR